MDKDKRIGEGVQFDRIRRITGYLVGTVDRMNDAKQHEVADRVLHDTSCECRREGEDGIISRRRH